MQKNLIKVETVSVTDKDGNSAPAHLFRCGVCNETAFMCYLVAHNPGEHPHTHLQCAGCGTTYCQQEHPSIPAPPAK